MKVAIIPARGGSKRIPGKNIKLFLGRPMIHYSIAAAQSSGLFDRVVVSTDSEEIAQTARQAGAETPFLRPAELSDDFTTTVDVLLHGIEALGGPEIVETICCLYATAPFVQGRYLLEGERILREKKCGSVFSVTTYPFPIFRSLKISASGRLEMYWPEFEKTRSNDLPEAYHDAGQFYWLDSATLLKTKAIYTKEARPVILPRYFVQDIDTPEDWQSAEILYETLQQRGLIGRDQLR
ncbi:MAG: pseudaminic acid cytidylyltransferase [Magnetococcales bacterium]|nr:pseudaminic acid cytidylyltransferase [Magnetococcales bacterium]